MGANESIPRTPPFFTSPGSPHGASARGTAAGSHTVSTLQPNHPFHSLLRATSPPPTDPESDYYIHLFNEFFSISQASSRPLSPLVSTALSAPTSTHAATLSISLRAAIHHLRHGAHPRTLGALHFAFAILSDLRRLSSSHDAATLALAATPAELQLPIRDRIDLARSLRARLVSAVLHLLNPTLSLQSSVEAITDRDIYIDSHSLTRQLRATSVPVLLIVLSADIDSDATLAAALAHHSAPFNSIVGILDSLAHVAQYVNPSSQLTCGVLRQGMRQIPNTGNGVSVWDTWGSFAATTAALNFRSSFTDVVSALSTVSSRFSGPKMSDSVPRTTPTTSSDFTSTSNRSSATHDSMPASSPRLSASETQNGFSSPKFQSDTHFGKLPDTADGSNAQQVEELLTLLAFLCRPTNDNLFFQVICNLEDDPTVGADDGKEDFYSFSKLYDILGQVMTDPKGAYLGFLLLVRNKRFRTFAMARTDPDVLFMPLLASLRARCSVGAVPADGYVAAAILLVLTSDKGICGAINDLTVPETWLPLMADRARLTGDTLTVGEAVLVVCARVVQQSLVTRRKLAEEYLCGICLGVLGNVAPKITNIQPFVAERVVSLIEFLGRRRRRAVAQVIETCDVSKHNFISKQDVQSCALIEKLSKMIGMTLEIIVGILRARSTVAANKHLVYVLMQRDGGLDGEHIAGSSVKARALVHMIGRMVHFFGDCVEQYSTNMSTVRSTGHVAARSTGSHDVPGISVERVFEAIEQNARFLDRNVFDGMPDLDFRLKECDSDNFLQVYAETLLDRLWKRTAEDESDAVRIRRPGEEVGGYIVNRFRIAR